ncbi:MAG: hypothetical protein ACIAQ0_12030 [Phycisphaerales bacterium JB058]
MKTRLIGALVALALLYTPLARAQEDDAGAGGDRRQIDMRQAPPSFRLGIRALTHRHARQASPVLVIADSPESYVKAIAGWDERVIYPVLIDDGSWQSAENIGRFVRGFKPEKIVRLSGDEAETLPEDRAGRQEHFERTLASIWGQGRPDVAGDEVMTELVSHLQFAVHMPPGIVVADVNDPAWTAGLALAAGHAQPIMWYDRSKVYNLAGGTLSQAQSEDLLGAIELRLEELGMPWQGLGDTIDAVTIAMNLPVKCNLDMGEKNSERFALTDVIGLHRSLSSPRMTNLQRWAWSGQIFGTEAEAAYRAMCSLFLQPSQAWIFDGYPSSDPWNAYDGTLTKENLAKANLPATLLDDPRNGVDSWHAATTQPLDADVVFVNTKGLAEYFDLEPGRAYAADVPVLDRPVAVSYVHSWSANRPDDPTTIAGSWFRAGAYMYVGSVHEPFLQAFIPTPIFALRLMGGLPWGVACRPDGASPVWKIAVVGDPLLAIGAERPRADMREIEGGTELASEIREAVGEDDFARVIRTQAMLGQDAEIARLVSAMVREKSEMFTAEVARIAAMPAFRAHNKELLVECVLKLDKETLDKTGIGRALWHIAESDLRTSVDVKLASALERTIGGPSIVRDTERLAGAVEVAQGVNIRNVLVDRIAESAQDASQAREIRKLRR